MKRYELIVLGGGITGSFAAYVASKNRARVAIVEEDTKPNGATARSGGVVTRMLDDPEDMLLAVKSIRLINEVFRGDKEVIHRGYLCIEDYEEAQRDLERFRRYISDIKLLHPDEILNKWHYIRLYEDEVGLYSEGDMTIEPDVLLRKLWGKLEDLGVDLMLGKKCKELVIKGQAIHGVKLHSGSELRCENVLVALGAWTKGFLKMHGIKVKTFLLSVPIFRFKVDECELVGLWDEAAYSYWRPSTASTLVGGGYEAYKISKPEEGFLKPNPLSEKYITDLFRYRYKFSRWAIVDAWCGPISVSYSYHPIAMSVNKVGGLYVIDGLGGYGLVRGPALAEDLVNRMFGE